MICNTIHMVRLVCHLHSRTALSLFYNGHCNFMFHSYAFNPLVTCTTQKRLYSSRFSRVITHKEKKIVPVPIDIMYDVVCDVDKYKEFIPWCTKSIVTSKTVKTAKADLAIGFGPVQEHYKSTLVFNKPKYIKSICSDGRLFKLLDCTWKFSEVPKSSNTFVSFDVEFEFRSIMYTKLAQVFFDEVVKKMVSAFEKRAMQKYSVAKLQKKS